MSGRLPNFVGIGAVKCGTTSIHRYLGEHREVFVSPIKETNFFTYEGQEAPLFRVRSWRAYQRQFAGARGEKAIGEFSPQYMNNPPQALRTAERIASALPGVQLLASVRSPADRAYSHWLAGLRQGIEKRPAEVALEPGNRYIDRGYYRARLEPYLKLFSRERIKIVVYEEFVADPVPTMQEIYRFLGVDARFVPSVEIRHNPARSPRHPGVNAAWQRLRRLQPHWLSAPAPVVRLNRALLERSFGKPPPFDAALRSRLLELYADEVARMEDLLGRELPMWSR